jgi:NTE family protein
LPPAIGKQLGSKQATRNPNLRIGLALSGGGVRAAGFHLGVLDRLARQQLLEQTTFISTVSGGSLIVGLIFSLATNRWPSSADFRSTIVGSCQRILTTQNLQRNYLTRVLLSPWKLTRGRASLLAASLKSVWGITGNLKDLPAEPGWIINATTYETGKNWRMSHKRMGEYETQYVLDPTLPLAEAMAASAAVPGVIGPLVIHSKAYSWHRYTDDSKEVLIPTKPRFRILRLWDGGVYDNLGIEALYKRNRSNLRGEITNYREGVDFLLISDASRPVASDTGTFQSALPFYKPPMRLIDIATEQVRGLRARDIVDYFQEHPGTGAYLRMGNTASSIYGKAGITAQNDLELPDGLGENFVALAARPETALRRLSAKEFQILFEHGYEVADSTLTAYCGESFSHIPMRMP